MTVVQQPRLQQDWQALGFAPGAALRMFGMRRSGNHAVAGWLQRNAPDGRAVFLNNCKPAAHPFKSFRGIEVNRTPGPVRKAKADLAAAAGQARDGALLLISYEDCCPGDFSLDQPVSGGFAEELLTGNILIIRSFLNWAASLLKKMQPNPSYTLSQRCGILLRSFATYTRMLELAGQAGDLGLTVVRYDDWVADAESRNRTLDALGLAARDNTLGAVQRYGGGSSFQKDAATAADLQTSQRWQQMAENAEFQAVLHLAARDAALLGQLERHYPQDAARLLRVAEQAPLAPGGLA